MKLFKSALSILLVTAMLMPLIACADGDSKDKETTAPVTTTPSVTTPSIFYEEDDLPDDIDFEGEKVIICSPSSGQAANDITVEDLNSDVVNDSIYNREMFVEDRLGVEIENIKTGDENQDFQKQLVSGEDTYQIWVGKTYDFSKYSFEDALIDLNSVEYLDLDKPWWSQHFISEASIGDNLYLTTGSITLSLLRNLIAVYYNKDLAVDYAHNIGLEDLNDIYTVVESGKWTLDKFYSLSGSIYQDLNGNTEKDPEDLYGLGVHKYSLDTIWSSFDLNVLDPTDGGWFEINVNTDKLFNAIEKTTDLVHMSEGCLVAEEDDLPSAFASGSILFAVDYIYRAENNAIRNMSDEYGLIPFPKYDENQKDYYSYPYDEYLSYAIPNTNPNPNIAGAVMEALASYSYRDTEPAYLDTALKGKYMNDPQSRTMVDLIVDGFKLDASWIYIFTIGGGYPSGYRGNIFDNERTYASDHASRAKTVQTRLKAYKPR